MNKTNPRMVYYLERPDETRVAEFRVRWNNLLKIQADLHFTNADGADVVLSLRSNEKWYEKFDIFYQEQRVAYVERHDYNCKVKKEEGASQTYDLNVAANLDTMLVSKCVDTFCAVWSAPLNLFVGLFCGDSFRRWPDDLSRGFPGKSWHGCCYRNHRCRSRVERSERFVEPEDRAGTWFGQELIR